MHGMAPDHRLRRCGAAEGWEKECGFKFSLFFCSLQLPRSYILWCRLQLPSSQSTRRFQSPFALQKDPNRRMMTSHLWMTSQAAMNCSWQLDLCEMLWTAPTRRSAYRPVSIKGALLSALHSQYPYNELFVV